MYGQGRLPDADRLYRAVLARDPKNFDALYLLGMLTMQQQRIDEAATLVSAAVERNPASCDALMLLGSVMLTQRRFDEALGCFDRAVAMQPKNIDARYNRAVALDQAGRLPQALAGYDHVVAAQPQSAAAWFNRANVLARLCRLADAVGSYDRALALAPRNSDALLNRGNALAGLHRHEAALASFDQVLALQPAHVDALSNRATTLKALGRMSESLASSERALAIQPNHVNALVARGNVLLSIEKWTDALACYDKALAVTPHDVEIIANRGLSLIGLKRPEEALVEAERSLARDSGGAAAHYAHGNALHALVRDAEAVVAFEKALAIQPDYPDVYSTYGAALQGLERHEEAIPNFAKAIALRPDFADPKWGGSLSYLSCGLFAEGWELYEHRWAPHLRSAPPRDYTQPLWDGRRMPGVLLVWGEQGPGDVVMYSSLVSALEPYAEKVILEVEARLVKLFERSFPGFEIIPAAPELYTGRIDAHLPIGSVPKYLVKTWDDFPKRERGFLVPDAARVRGLRQRLAADGRPAIGLTWISNNPKVGKFKSAQLEEFEPLLRLPGYRFVDLQYGDTAEERDTVERELGVRIEHLDDIDNRNDLDGLAALVAACDAVLTVSSTTAHIAGGVGAPTWVMLPYGRGRFWYWFAQKPTSPWYPSVQVRRQEPGQSWAKLVGELTPEIAAAAVKPWMPPA